ncbi:MAG: hypothetical protein JSR28_08025 [Proteobacteria bacterium]|nr:hypothetical protein [Pseudomonadota bacterium]MDE2411251.1 hypothetical protein [Sphingomonadales bacterium]
MGPGEFMSLVAVIIGMVATMGMLVSGYKSRLRVKERELELRLAEAQARAAAAEPADTRIEQRLRVLERIATDKGQDIAAQIEQLRDNRAARQAEDA